MKSHIRRMLACAGIALSLCAGANAQERPVMSFRDSYAGDCTITLEVPETADLDTLIVRLNRQPLSGVVSQISPVVLSLLDRLDAGDRLEAEIGGAIVTTIVKERPSGVRAAGRCISAPLAPPVWEGRGLFDPTFYFGKAIDNFAPAQIAGYNDVVRDAVRSRAIGGINLDLRVWGWRNEEWQFWVGASTMNGVRSADIDCNESVQAVLCRDFNPADATKAFLRTIEHASSLEAHFAPRWEVLTLNRNAPTPVRMFVGGQLGFLALEGGAKVFEADHFGGGALAPKGPFRGSQVFWGWGRTTLFKTHPGWNRLKIKGVMIVDAFAGLAERFPVLRHFGFGSWRGFIAIDIDRNPKGDGPDSVQTYYGAAFDFEKAFSGR
jgi:hypothetical protein